ncbi:MAG: hypothetical protein ACLQVY_19775 [Limisphaerales bacterium]
MKQTNAQKANMPKRLILPPAYPHPSTKMLWSLRNTLCQECGRQLTFDQLGQIMGVTRTTADYWCHDHESRLIRSLFCLLERLSPGRRSQFLDAHCREYPRLEHPRLAHVPGTNRKLRGLLQKNSGITFICGGTDDSRTFVMTAMGHALLDVIAIGAFAGLRTAEIERLEWQDVDQSGGFIEVKAAKAKTRSRRLVPISLGSNRKCGKF